MQALHIQLDIVSLRQRLTDVTMRFEIEKNNAEHRRQEVFFLRRRIAELKSLSFALVKGYPISSIDVRVNRSSRSSSSNSNSDLSELLSFRDDGTSDLPWSVREEAKQLLE